MLPMFDSLSFGWGSAGADAGRGPSKVRVNKPRPYNGAAKVTVERANVAN